MQQRDREANLALLEVAVGRRGPGLVPRRQVRSIARSSCIGTAVLAR